MDLSQLAVDVFIKHITYLPFDTVVSICNTNKKLHSYCTDPSYSLRWKALINNTFSGIDGYDEKLKQIWNKLYLPEDTYNYNVYTRFIDLLDPQIQLNIYYRQGDMNTFNSNKFNRKQRTEFMSNLLNNEDFYGIIEDDKFILAINLKNKTGVGNGLVKNMQDLCTKYTIPELVDIMWSLNIESPPQPEVSTEEMIRFVNKYTYVRQTSSQRLKFLYDLFKQNPTKDSLCNLIKTGLEKMQRIIY